METVEKYSTPFMKRTLTIYNSQVKRFSEKRNKRGRITRAGRVIPYCVAQFRVWVANHFSERSVVLCHYCGAPFDVLNFCTDHDVPVSRGGSLDISNLGICCDTCNRIKGSLTGKEYEAFRAGMVTFPEAARNDIYGRLKTGAGFIRLRFMKPKTQTQLLEIGE